MCLDHFIEQAFERLRSAREACQQCRSVDPWLLEWLLADADLAVQSLAQNGHAHTQEQRDRLLELLLGLSNLQEYLRHHSVSVLPAD